MDPFGGQFDPRSAMRNRARVVWASGSASPMARFGLLLAIAVGFVLTLLLLLILIPAMLLAAVAFAGWGLFRRARAAIGGAFGGRAKDIEGRENVRVIERR